MMETPVQLTILVRAGLVSADPPNLATTETSESRCTCILVSFASFKFPPLYLESHNLPFIY